MIKFIKVAEKKLENFSENHFEIINIINEQDSKNIISKDICLEKENPDYIYKVS